LIQACHRRFQEWKKGEIWLKTFTTLALDFEIQSKMDLAETFIDSNFGATKKTFLALFTWLVL
jgi:hypothetical protein